MCFIHPIHWVSSDPRPSFQVSRDEPTTPARSRAGHPPNGERTMANENANANGARSNLEIAIVTGGSRGLGRSTVISLARRGVHSIFTYHANRAEADRV